MPSTPAIGAKIYSWISDGNTRRVGIEAATLLWERQQRSLIALRSCGIVTKVNTILIPEVNEGHVAKIAETVSELGAGMLNIMPLYPVSGTPFAALLEPGPDLLRSMRSQAARYLPQMTHCTRCRADTVGTLAESGCASAFLDSQRNRCRPTLKEL